MEPATAGRRVLVWDLPTRIFHWLLVGAFAGTWLTSDERSWLDVHARFGYTLLALVAFRIAWGLAGTRHARFASFVRGPRAVAAYLHSLVAGRPQHHAGHNPAGGWAILALLVLALVAGASGLATWLGGEALEDLHEAAATAMLVVAAVHVAGVVVGSLAHRENLVRAMVTGYTRARPGGGIGGPRRAVAALLVAAVAIVWSAPVPVPGPPETVTAVKAGKRDLRHAGRHRD